MKSFEVTMNSRGQFTLPAELRAMWSLKPGDKVEFYLDRENMLRVRRRNLPPSAVWERAAPKRRLPRKAKTMTDDEAIMAAVLEKDRRSRRRRRV